MNNMSLSKSYIVPAKVTKQTDFIKKNRQGVLEAASKKKLLNRKENGEGLGQNDKKSNGQQPTINDMSQYFMECNDNEDETETLR